MRTSSLVLLCYNSLFRPLQRIVLRRNSKLFDSMFRRRLRLLVILKCAETANPVAMKQQIIAE